jgi:subtilisin family serine protease
MATILSAVGAAVQAQVDAAVRATTGSAAVPPGTFLFRTFDVVTADCPWKTDQHGSVQAVLEGLDPAFVLCGDGSIVRRQDFGPGSTLVGPFKFSAKLQLAQSGAASPLFAADLTTPPNLLSIDLSAVITPDLGFTVAETRGTPTQLASTTPAVTGAGIIVGIIDYGFDFAHPNFLQPIDPANPVPKTRVLALWDQNDLGSNSGVSTLLTAMGITTNYDNSYVYGPDGQVQYRDSGGTTRAWPAVAARDINKQLVKADPYAGYYDPHQRYFTWPPNAPTSTDIPDQFGAHGTHVADIAAGNGQGTGKPGVAPQADIVFVQLASPSGPGGPPTGQTLLDAVQFIAKFARNAGKPCVINISANLNAGAHNLTEDALLLGTLDKYPNGSWDGGANDYQPLVISAGNQFVLGREPAKLPDAAIYPRLRKAYRESLQQRVTLNAGGSEPLFWVTRKGDTTTNCLELWYLSGGSEDVAVKVESTMSSVAQQTVAQNNTDISITTTAGVTLGRIKARGMFAANKPRKIAIELNFTGTAPCLQDIVFVVTIASAAKRSVQAFVQRDNMDAVLQSALAIPNVQGGEANVDTLMKGCSLGTLACGSSTIVVGAYFAPDRQGRGAAIAEFSSAGPAVDFSALELPSTGIRQPWISAPGMIVLAAKSKGGRSYTSGTGTTVPKQPYAVVMSGTSMAAPHVTGAVALMLHKRGAVATTILRTALEKTARREAPWFDPAMLWHPRLGYGRLDIKAALDSI